MTTPSFDVNDILVELQKVNNHLMDAQERQNFASEQRNNRNTQFVIDQIGQAHSHTDDIINRTSNVNLSSIDTTRDALYSTTAALGVQNERGVNEIVSTLATGFRDTSNNLSHFAVATARDFGQVARDNFQIERELAKVETILGSKIDNTLAQVQLQAANNKSDLLQNQNLQFAQLQLQAANNKGDVMQKMADCCCEIKEKICETDTGRLRDVLQAAEIRNAGLEFGRDRFDRFDRWGPGHGGHGGPGPWPR